MDKYLVVSVLGNNQQAILSDLSKAISDAGCTIVNSRACVMGEKFGAILLLAGNWSAIAKVESNLPTLENKFKISINALRSESEEHVTRTVMPYSVHVVGLDKAGIAHLLAEFFAQQGIEITELRSNTYHPSQASSTRMFSLFMEVEIPLETHIADLRERFGLLCDDLNLDAIMEPEKPMNL